MEEINASNDNMTNDVYKDDCEIEILARSSKYGAISQNTLTSFSSGAFNFHRPN